MRWLSVVTVLALAACSSPTPSDELRAAQSTLVSEAMAYQRRMEANGYVAVLCGAQHERYQADLAAFKKRYGGGK